MEGEQLQGNPTALLGRNEAAASGLVRWSPEVNRLVHLEWNTLWTDKLKQGKAAAPGKMGQVRFTWLACGGSSQQHQRGWQVEELARFGRWRQGGNLRCAEMRRICYTQLNNSSDSQLRGTGMTVNHRSRKGNDVDHMRKGQWSAARNERWSTCWFGRGDSHQW